MSNMLPWITNVYHWRMILYTYIHMHVSNKNPDLEWPDKEPITTRLRDCKKACDAVNLCINHLDKNLWISVQGNNGLPNFGKVTIMSMGVSSWQKVVPIGGQIFVVVTLVIGCSLVLGCAGWCKDE